MKLVFDQGWIKKAERIRCSAPLPEDSADPVLTRMLAPAPYQMPAKEDKKKCKRAEGGLRSKRILDATSEETEASSSEDED